MEGKQIDGQETAVANPAGLYQFLAEEVRHAPYADLLLERAEAAGTANVEGASGNAYNVSFGPEQVTIEHHWVDNWPPVQISRQRFISALRSWKAAGCGNASA